MERFQGKITFVNDKRAKLETRALGSASTNVGVVIFTKDGLDILKKEMQCKKLGKGKQLVVNINEL